MTNTVTVQRIACKAVIINDGKVLVLREASTYEEGTNIGKYGLPGGRVDVGEPFLDGLHREVAEETGLRVEISRPVHVDEWFPVIKGAQNQIIGIFFVCTPLSDDIVLSEEHDDYKWVDLAESRQLAMMEAETRALEKYFSPTAE